MCTGVIIYLVISRHCLLKNRCLRTSSFAATSRATPSSLQLYLPRRGFPLLFEQPDFHRSPFYLCKLGEHKGREVIPRETRPPIRRGRPTCPPLLALSLRRKPYNSYWAFPSVPYLIVFVFPRVTFIQTVFDLTSALPVRLLLRLLT